MNSNFTSRQYFTLKYENNVGINNRLKSMLIILPKLTCAAAE